jgi:hypothetical protein
VPSTILPSILIYEAGQSGGQQPAHGLPQRRHAERLVYGGDVLGEFAVDPLAADMSMWRTGTDGKSRRTHSISSEPLRPGM